MSEACELRAVYICACLCWNVQLYTCVCSEKFSRTRAFLRERVYRLDVCIRVYVRKCLRVDSCREYLKFLKIKKRNGGRYMVSGTRE